MKTYLLLILGCLVGCSSESAPPVRAEPPIASTPHTLVRGAPIADLTPRAAGTLAQGASPAESVATATTSAAPMLPPAPPSSGTPVMVAGGSKPCLKPRPMPPSVGKYMPPVYRCVNGEWVEQ